VTVDTEKLISLDIDADYSRPRLRLELADDFESGPDGLQEIHYFNQILEIVWGSGVWAVGWKQALEGLNTDTRDQLIQESLKICRAFHFGSAQLFQLETGGDMINLELSCFDIRFPDIYEQVIIVTPTPQLYEGIEALIHDCIGSLNVIGEGMKFHRLKQADCGQIPNYVVEAFLAIDELVGQGQQRLFPFPSL